MQPLIDAVARRRWLALVLSVAALAVAGCGSDDDDSGAGGSTTGSTTGEQAAAPSKDDSGYVYAGTKEDTDEARKAGEEDAESKVDPPEDKSIGIIQLSGQSATSIVITAAAREIADMFGYEVHVCDPNFDPQKIPQCATSIVAQNPSVIFSVSQNPGPMGSAMRQAAERDIPWFGTGSAAEESEFLNDYGAEGFEISHAINEWMFEEMGKRNPDADNLEVFAIVAPTVGVASQNQQAQLEKDARAAGNIDLVTHDLDLPNAVQDTLSSSRRALEQNPNLAAMWTLCDFCLPLMAQTVGNRQSGDRKTVVAGMYSNPQTIADIRKGSADAVADYAWALPVWVGMDQALQNWARDKEIVQGFDVFESYSLPFMKPYVITRENAGDSGPIPVYGPDFETYFKTKWAEEFGVGE
jgi:ABC-type sugar transport system substrate-binding protein